MVLSLVLVPASQSAPALAATSSLSLFFILLVRWPLDVEAEVITVRCGGCGGRDVNVRTAG